MSKLLDSVDQRTQLVGENRLELLTFRLAGRQLFALNVFKIQEVLQVPNLTALPHSNPVICGVTHLRNQTISVIDLSAAIGGRPLKGRENCNLIVTEYNRTVQAFLVGAVDRIVNLNWELILPPPKGSGRSHFLTAITQLDDEIVEILDVERVLADIVPYETGVSDEVLDKDLLAFAQANRIKVLMADDSTTAYHQASSTLQNLGVETVYCQDGLKALKLLKRQAAEGVDICSEYLMLITDAEMPEMDGYRLTHEVRSDPNLRDLYVILHTSLSGSFNQAMVKKVGCDDFLSKFQPDELAGKVQERLRIAMQKQ
ncbi:chemotaxis protein CheV [Pseudomaricurvus alkylphenolicus]|jgi:two-component system chemotaxis response regulator CheV|uniref:chemotaxis protein n=1 Tax=Pseudomaricurvus alkylphenolicus TaxID=1306991 RepID=UPI0014248D53|nr:chemotaxis protein [Pseudomaricurvus alkylphenolicus]NIB41297.1 chemotaxis protein CheV [Pseudomaricurvus alkylphenolicus]